MPYVDELMQSTVYVVNYQVKGWSLALSQTWLLIFCSLPAVCGFSMLGVHQCKFQGT